ncbi:MAG: hypothetical protein V3W41_07840 [Planctomycetota bacterium]
MTLKQFEGSQALDEFRARKRATANLAFATQLCVKQAEGTEFACANRLYYAVFQQAVFACYRQLGFEKARTEIADTNGQMGDSPFYRQARVPKVLAGCRVISRSDRDDFASIKDLRVKADYSNFDVEWDEIEEHLALANSIYDMLNKKFGETK